MTEISSQDEPIETPPDCTFCNEVAFHAIHAVDGAESWKCQLPVCEDHWRDYLKVVATVQDTEDEACTEDEHGPL